MALAIYIDSLVAIYGSLCFHSPTSYHNNIPFYVLQLVSDSVILFSFPFIAGRIGEADNRPRGEL
jgi:hypothetical protein